jgi:pre-mRNA-processing factor 6
VIQEVARKWFENAIRVNPDYGDAYIYYYKSEILFGDEHKLEEKCEKFNPRHGDLWISVSKAPKNWKLNSKEILILASDLVNY